MTDKHKEQLNWVAVDAGDPPDERAKHLEHFPELFLGERDYKWQYEVLRALSFRDSRVLLCAANGSGKTAKIIARAILWHMMRFPGGLTVMTAGVYRQVADALWPHLRRYIRENLGGEQMGWKITEDAVEFAHPSGAVSRAIGFSVADPNKAEGWHRQGVHDALLYIIDEAKGVPDGVFDAMERCQPSRLLIASSPGGPAGRFFDLWQKGGKEWRKFRVTAYDCPHLPQSWIDTQIATYGENSPLIRSMIHADFAEDGNEALVLPPSVLQKAMASPPKHEKGTLAAGCDFAAGGDENVLAIRDGNRLKDDRLIAWKEKNTMAAVGRFVTEFRLAGLKEDRVYADAGGLGVPMCDALREAGWTVRRVNNGEAPYDKEKFADRATEMWVRFARLVETGKVIVPADDELLFRQLTTRRLEFNSKGKLKLEAKEDMRKRGLSSPDRADAVILAFCGGGLYGEDFAGLSGYDRRGATFAQLQEAAEQVMDDGEKASASLDGCSCGA